MFHLFSGRARRCSFWVPSWEAASLLQIYCYCRWGWWFWWTPSNFCPIKWGNRDPCSDSQLKAFVSSLSFLLALSLSSIMPSHSQSFPLTRITPKPQTCQAISSIKASACCSLILSHDSFPQSLNDRSFPHLLCQVTCHRPELAPL